MERAIPSACFPSALPLETPEIEQGKERPTLHVVGLDEVFAHVIAHAPDAPARAHQARHDVAVEKRLSPVGAPRANRVIHDVHKDWNACDGVNEIGRNREMVPWHRENGVDLLLPHEPDSAPNRPWYEHAIEQQGNFIDPSVGYVNFQNGYLSHGRRNWIVRGKNSHALTAGQRPKAIGRKVSEKAAHEDPGARMVARKPAPDDKCPRHFRNSLVHLVIHSFSRMPIVHVRGTPDNHWGQPSRRMVTPSRFVGPTGRRLHFWGAQVYSKGVPSIVGRIPQRASLVRSFFETRGQSWSVSARLYFNKVVYAFIRSTGKMPAQGWLHSRQYWFDYPLSLRGRVLWSAPLQAWFAPEDETALEYMLHLESYEPVQWVQPCEGEVFIDVGGYIGSYSISAAKAVGPAGQVVILEPESNNRRQLERNLALNGITNCQVLPLAAWSASGTVGWHQDNHPVWHRVEEARDDNAVDAVRIDDVVHRLSLTRVDWIKMDIEGVELDALKGAEGTLRRFRPKLFIEIHETLKPVTELLAEFGYSIVNATFDVQPKRHGWILARGS